MKIALITYHSADNYGATLQAYATYKILKELGNDVQIIDLRINQPNPIIKKLLLFFKHKRFNDFRSRHLNNVTCRYSSFSSLQRNPPQADVYLVGSDQVWNVDISGEFVKAYFLDFGDAGIKRISYASSFGKEIWKPSNYITTDEVKSLLGRFDAIGVRERSGVEICSSVFKLRSTQVIDPVLLHTNYNEITGDINNSTNEIVLYKIINDSRFYNRAIEISSNLNLPLRSIGSIRKIKTVKSSYPEKISKWIERIASASYVVTDSFHGTVLCLLYRKKFIVYVGDPKLLTRIGSLLSMVGLENRICSYSDDIDKVLALLKSNIDYNMVFDILEKARLDSISFIKKSLAK